MQRFDGIDPAFLWQLNSEADRPDLAVILEADPETIAERLSERGPHNRFQLSPGSSHAEVHFYRQATNRLIQAGFLVTGCGDAGLPQNRLRLSVLRVGVERVVHRAEPSIGGQALKATTTIQLCACASDKRKRT